MQRGSQDNACITTDIVQGADGPKGGQIIGINLGYDFCAEHERGIGSIKETFGIPGVTGDKVGADARTVTRVPDELKFFENLGGYAYLLLTPAFRYLEESEFTAEQFDKLLEVRRDEEFSTAWDDRGFGIRMKNDALTLGATVLGQIYEALTKRDAMIFLSGSNNPFAGNGLVLAIRSRVPEDLLTQMKEADDDHLNLVKAAEATDIKEKLRAAGKRYFALSPRWKSADEAAESEHPVVFWLNPMEQQENNFGWFTVEQLLEWIDGKGPIPMQKAA